MISKALFVYAVSEGVTSVLSERYCVDIEGRKFDTGYHYIPGPEQCQICICYHGKPKDCKDVLCAQPTTCKAYRRGSKCCEVICVDDAITKTTQNYLEYNQDFGVRVMIACAVTAMLFISLGFFLVYRFKWNKNNARANQSRHNDDQRSLTSVGYIGGGGGYMRSSELSHCPAGWKPHYLPRGEAPPPYDEAIAQTNAEYYRGTSEMPMLLHRSLSVSHTVRTQDLHSYANMPTPATVNQMVNSRNTSQYIPLLQSSRGSEPETSSYTSLHITTSDGLNFAHSARLAQSLGTINSQSLLGTEYSNDGSVPYGGQGLLQIASNHRTIPRSLNCPTDSNPQSFYLTTQHRSHPRFEVLQSDEERLEKNRLLNDGSLRNSSRSRRSDPNSEAYIYDKKCNRNSLAEPTASLKRSRNGPIGDCASQLNGHGRAGHKYATMAGSLIEQSVSTLPKAIDKPSCECSYNAHSSSTEDDFRNECDNCKTPAGSRWRSEDWNWIEPGTQSLQRPNAPPSNHGVTTLPSRGPKVGHPLLPNNWESWFNSIGADSSSDED